jgi:uncharacterized protein YndB with AHSA1/START domain
VSVETLDRELVITRIIDAPRSVVFRLWTEPAHLANWMGPRGFSAEYVTHDFRPGGAWRACLHREGEGRDLWNGGVFREIVEPERLVFTFAWDDKDGRPRPETVVTVSLAEHEGKTMMTFHQATFDTTLTRDDHRGGWSSSFDRLGECAAKVRER